MENQIVDLEWKDSGKVFEIIDIVRKHAVTDSLAFN